MYRSSSDTICNGTKPRAIPDTQLCFKGSAKYPDDYTFISDSFYKVKGSSTNIASIVDAGASSMVNTLILDFGLARYLHSLANDKEIAAMLAKNDWSGITSVYISMEIDYGCERHVDYYIEPSQHVDDVKKFADLLFANMPNVVDITVSKCKFYADAIEFGKQLVGLYSSQIKRLQCLSVEILGSLSQLSALEHLVVDFEKSVFLSKLNLNKLKSLHMRNFEESCWGSFCSYTDVPLLEFPCLTELGIYFSNLGTTNSSRYINEVKKVAFPSLNKLCLSLPSSSDIDLVFSSGQYEWPNVIVLEIDSFHSMSSLSNTSGTYAMESIEANAKDVCRLLPELCRITSTVSAGKSPLANKAIERFFSILVDHYRDQLDFLSIRSPLVGIEPVYFSRLQTLSISLKHGNVCYLVQKNMKTICNLSLFDVPLDFTWMSLFDDAASLDSNMLDFDSLTTLGVNFATSPNDKEKSKSDFVTNWNKRGTGTGTDTVLNFPVLKKLCISNFVYSSLLNILCFGTEKWSNVSRLELDISHAASLNFSYANNTETAVDEILSQYVDYIAHNIPNITDFVFSGSQLDSYVMFCDLILKAYKSKLETLDCSIPAFETTVHQLESCKNLKLEYVIEDKGCSGKDEHATTEYTKKLEHVELTNMPLSSLGLGLRSTSSSDENNVLLNDLKSLSVNLKNKTVLRSSNQVHNNDSNRPDTGDYIFHMPNLCNMSIVANPVQITPCNTVVCVKSLENVHLDGPLEFLPYCGSSDIDVKCSVEIALRKVDEKDEDKLYKITNSWLKHSHTTGSASLTLDDVDFRLNVARIHWENLTNLHLNGTTELEVVVGLLPKLGRLMVLTLENCKLGNLSYKYQLDEKFSKKSPKVLPLSTSVVHMGIDRLYSNTKQNPAFVNALKYLLLAIPSLEKGVIESFLFNQSSRFITKYSKQYPHLKK